jgi:hypothetical protein
MVCQYDAAGDASQAPPKQRELAALRYLALAPVDVLQELQKQHLAQIATDVVGRSALYDIALEKAFCDIVNHAKFQPPQTPTS